MKPVDELRELEERIVRARAYGTLSDGEYDGLLERMDALWVQLSDEERDEVDKRQARIAKQMRQKELAEDVRVSKSAPVFPRLRTVA